MSFFIFIRSKVAVIWATLPMALLKTIFRLYLRSYKLSPKNHVLLHGSMSILEVAARA